ncbi:MAG: hypothetical protein JKY22_00495, partial [Flavobacteriaceae bacterium]|nr:hypothetical protein [Flavobacteriaceae bacterium]
TGTIGNGVAGRDGYNGRDGESGKDGEDGKVEFIKYLDYLVANQINTSYRFPTSTIK